MSSSLQAFGASLYFMNDKNIHDGLLAKRITTDHMISILKNRGILVSAHSTKNELLQMFKTIRFDYFEYVHLSALLENPNRKDSKSRTDIKEKVTINHINNAANNIKDKLKETGAGVKVEAISAKKILLKTSYLDIDYTRPPMRQKLRKTAIVEINIDGKTTNINYPATKMGKQLKEEIVSQAKESFGSDIEPIEIDFEFKPIKLRTDFFTRLISGIDGYDVFDVVSTCLKREGKESGEEKDEDFTGTVRNAVLTGRSVLTTKIYDSLPDEKYYIYKITWKIRYNDKSKGTDESDCYTIEAQFDESDKAKGFKYLVKSVQRYTQNKLNSSTSTVEKSKANELSKLVYESALKIYQNLNDGT